MLQNTFTRVGLYQTLTRRTSRSLSFLGFRVGFPDHSKPYEITALQRNTTVRPIQNAYGMASYYEAETIIEINIFCKRINRDNVDPQLGNMEREVQRIICNYNKFDVEGISDIVLERMERIYNARDTYAKTEWRTLVTLRMKYEFQAPTP